MAKEEYDSWQTGSGLPDDYDGEITDAMFTTDANVQDGEALILRLTIQPDDIEEQVVNYSLGKGWESTDAGKTAKDEGGNAQRAINSSSKYGKLIDKIVELGLGDTLKSRGEATEASVWLGLSFHWKREKESFINREGKNQEYETLLPQEYLGDANEEKTAKTVKKSTPKKAATTSKVDKVAEARAKLAAKKNGSDDSGSLRDDLLELAKTHEDNESFQEAALEVDGVAEDDDLLDEIVNGGLFEEANA